jgi:AcrR family transcriptional regulator
VLRRPNRWLSVYFEYPLKVGQLAKSGVASKVASNVGGRSWETRDALVSGAISSLTQHGYAGTSARSIAQLAGVNQGLIFYHFGSVSNLLLASLDHVSAERMSKYESRATTSESADHLVDVAMGIFRDDLDSGYVTVLVEMIAGSSSDPELGVEVLNRIGPWISLARAEIEGVMMGSALESLVSAQDVAYTLVATFLGLEMLTHLAGDRTPAYEAFAFAQKFASLLGLASTQTTIKEGK